MAGDIERRVIASHNKEQLSWKHRAALALFGQEAAFGVASGVADARAWRDRNLTPAGRANKSYIQSFQNRHNGERCIIIGNGPSLRKTDLSLLRNETTFGLNRIYLMFDELGFETSYHVVINQLVVEQCAEDLKKIAAPLFTTLPNREHLKGAADVAYLNNLVRPQFSVDASKGIWEGATVTFAAMQLAYYMGFREVVLVGVDHRFAVSGPAHKVVESTGPDASHFSPDYFGKGFKWQLPDLETSELAYSLARTAYENNDRRIVDATVDGALTVFPKMPLEKALR